MRSDEFALTGVARAQSGYIPTCLSKTEIERLARAYVQAFARIIGPDRDIPGPDVYTNSMIMGWMADEYVSLLLSESLDPP